MLKLGILYKDGVAVNHRSFVKVLFNPILRLFGYQIVSFMERKFDDWNKNPIKLEFNKCTRLKKLDYQNPKKLDFDTLVKKRRFI